MKTETKKETCLKCGGEFEDENYNTDLPLAKRIYCNKCIDEIEAQEKK